MMNTKTNAASSTGNASPNSEAEEIMKKEAQRMETSETVKEKINEEKMGHLMRKSAQWAVNIGAVLGGAYAIYGTTRDIRAKRNARNVQASVTAEPAAAGRGR